MILQDAPYAIILEEDLEVAEDFLGTVHYSDPTASMLVCCHSYFSQTIGLMEKDSSVYCVSAWNDLVSICILIISLECCVSIGI